MEGACGQWKYGRPYNPSITTVRWVYIILSYGHGIYSIYIIMYIRETLNTKLEIFQILGLENFRVRDVL